MKRLMKLPVLLLILALGSSALLITAAMAQAPTPSSSKPPKIIADAGIRLILENKNINYDVVSNGKIFRVGYNQKDNRHQHVCIASYNEPICPTDLDPLNVRRIWAFAYSGKSAPPTDILNKLMRQSNQLRIGAWEMLDEPNGDQTVLFTIKAPSNTPPDTLVWMIEMAANIADQGELEFEKADREAHQGQDDYTPVVDKF